MFRNTFAALGRATTRMNRMFAGPVMNAEKTGARRTLADGAKQIEERYAKSLSIMHWAIAGGFVACIATVQATQQTEDKELKGKLMRVHKSFGVLMAGLAVPRIALRLTTKIPAALPGPAWEHFASKASHVLMYGVLIFMPLSGITMGYFGGKGLPFFAWNIPGKEEPVGAVAKQAYQTHKLVGQVLEYGLLPAHIGGAAMHTIRGHKIFARINPFR
mmetsp:Transcript_6218/g.9004  ORF Transcript_6218/g.9004 Transcript_6218/m.9004 type:complete len:217 (+) Transcript_6218:63-713(+)|eukprot:CAMPEP_0195523022 /NCGR_PEP_ID=MMETSP0794_2-20130614/21765_1 /TAXON_ID=515487 /ORGANISM="Stephanopyxis turris, Strain CCMP 815" /LENGTH=216 /DNA_ID=CAMNT_0040652921 /DNA_START=63 /DNA_END=713 /DNA_ORIENTATION=+